MITAFRYTSAYNTDDDIIRHSLRVDYAAGESDGVLVDSVHNTAHIRLLDAAKALRGLAAKIELRAGVIPPLPADLRAKVEAANA